MRHEFLSALIDTGCAAAGRGWAPQFVLLRRAGSLAGAMALFAKNHSYGEYVFDWAWAEAHERHGIDYYPKLVCAVPFTPVRGPRLLAASTEHKRTLVQAALELARETSSLHVLFAADADAAVLAEQGFLMRRTVQFHWANEGYASSDDFLARLSHARRKNIRQQRRRVPEAAATFRWTEGPASTSSSAACCRCRRFPPTGSRIRSSRARSSISSSARARASRITSTSWSSTVHSRRPEMRLKDKVAIVTGAGSGFGAGIARRF